MSYLVTAAAAVVCDPEGRVLLVQQCSGHRLWSLPGGRVYEGETPVHAVCREVRSETGLEVAVTDLVGLYHLVGGEDLVPELLAYTFRCTIIGGEASVNMPGKISRIGWHDPNVLPSPITATAPVAVADAIAARSGVVCDVARNGAHLHAFEDASEDEISEPAPA